MLLLDTHVLVWLLFEEDRLGSDARQTLDESWTLGEAAVSAMTFWEVAMLHDKGRMRLLASIPEWRLTLLKDGLSEIAVDGEIAARAGTLPGLQGDPADRIIVATALAGHRLITADERILKWNGNLLRHDARE